MQLTTSPPEVQAVPLADNDNASTEHRTLDPLDFGRSIPTRASQGPNGREDLASEYEDALASLSRIEAEASSTLERRLHKAKRFQAAYSSGRERTDMKKRRLGQRKGLLKLMQVEFRNDDPPHVTDRLHLYVKHILKISANVAAITGSGWPSTIGWLKKHLPWLTMRLATEALQEEFDRYVTEASAELAARIPSGSNALHTGPTPIEIAEDLVITTEQLRSAGANRCGLTSIDPEDRKTRDRNRKERDRRANGMTAQTDRTKTVELQALADRLGCSLRTVQRHAKAGTLGTLGTSRSVDVTKVSPAIGTLDGGQIYDTAPVSADNDDTTPAAVA